MKNQIQLLRLVHSKYIAAITIHYRDPKKWIKLKTLDYLRFLNLTIFNMLRFNEQHMSHKSSWTSTF